MDHFDDQKAATSADYCHAHGMKHSTDLPPQKPAVEVAEELFATIKPLSHNIRSSNDVHAVAAELQRLWGGECGDDVEAQVILAVLLKACCFDATGQAIIDDVCNSLDGK